jgi:hypothetical protein
MRRKYGGNKPLSFARCRRNNSAAPAYSHTRNPAPPDNALVGLDGAYGGTTCRRV